MKRCDKCVYWVIEQSGQDGSHDDDKQGECHRHAPSPLIFGVVHQILLQLTTLVLAADPEEKIADFSGWENFTESCAFWPITFGAAWCGDFQAKAVVSP